MNFGENSIELSMRILLLGKNGNLGRGIFHVFSQQNQFDLIAPNKKELDLTDSRKTLEFVAKIKPYMIINSASYTTNKSTSTDDAIKICKNNLTIHENLQFAAKSCEVLKYIDIGSASIYESFPRQVILEKDFINIDNYLPTLPYGNAKLIQTKKTIEQDSPKSTWTSLILPYIISFNENNLKETSGLFARISKQITEYIAGNNDLAILKNYDLTIKRQFVHSIDVGYFCKYLLEKEEVHGLVHMPKLQQMSINEFIQKHLVNFPRKSINRFQNSSTESQHPTIGSIWDNLINFNYKFTSDKCVAILQGHEL